MNVREALLNHAKLSHTILCVAIYIKVLFFSLANDCYTNGLVGFEGHEPGQLQQGLYPCDPPCDVPFSECSSGN